jgi:putative SbcD/Mre11-related phosphoesterase
MERLNKNTNKKYIFIGKCLFFPKEKILVVGDLHLGYETALRTRGLEFPVNQFQEMQEELEKTILHIKARFGKIAEIIFLGDVKHHFGFIGEEKEELTKLLRFLRKYVENENRIIFIKGNHEKNEKSGKFIDYYIVKDIAFVHGNKEFLEAYDKKINLVVMGHIHPSVVLSDKMKIKREKYKCFLVGRYKKKEFVVLPSFLNIAEGVSSSEFSSADFDEDEIDFSIVPQAELKDFEVFVCGEIGEEALGFGKLGKIS